MVTHRTRRSDAQAGRALLLAALAIALVRADSSEMGRDAYWHWKRERPSEPGATRQLLPGLPELATIHVLPNRQIFRSAVPAPLQSRVGSVFFKDGKQVLIRNFAGMTDILPERVLGPGRYEVFLQSWYLDRYWRISDIVIYVISPNPSRDTIAYAGAATR